MAAPKIEPLPPETFFEKVIHIGTRIVYRVTKKWNKGDNYLASIAAANEAAGAVIADFVKANPGWSVAASVDNDRIIYNAAIPASVKNRIPKIRQASFYITAPAKCPSSFPKEHQNIANYVWYMTTVVSGQ